MYMVDRESKESNPVDWDVSYYKPLTIFFILNKKTCLIERISCADISGMAWSPS